MMITFQDRYCGCGWGELETSDCMFLYCPWLDLLLRNLVYVDRTTTALFFLFKTENLRKGELNK